MTSTTHNDQLAARLRALASQAAECANGGCTLLFASADPRAETSTRLRAAAGFDTPDAARSAAGELLPTVQDAVASGEARQQGALAHPAPRSEAGFEVLPLELDGRVLGALAIGFPEPLTEAARTALLELASSAALQIDHARLAAEIAELNQRASLADADVEGKSDELLKLSEELFAQDIELLRNNEKLGKIEKLKNDFIEKMSRELRTPLNSIIEAIIAVIAGENETLSANAKRSLRDALDEGTAFQRTLQNILDLWRVKQNELPIETQDVNFSEVVEEAIFSVQETLDGKPVAIEKNFEGALPKLRTDLAKINQILFLLLDNAAKFTEQGRITINARLCDEALECEVRDTGIGICADDQQLVFDEFFQVDELTSSRYRGAGLGLALVRDLLVLLGGEVSLQSEAGKGSVFAFRLPVQSV